MSRDTQFFGSRTARSSYGMDSGPVDNWRRRGVCRTDPDRWFPDNVAAGGEARHICVRHCPVLDRCRAEMARQVAQECPPLGAVAAGVSWNQAGTVSAWQPMTKRCELCPPEMTAEEMRRAELDIAAYAAQTRLPVQPSQARVDLLAHEQLIVEMARGNATDREIAAAIGGHPASVGRVRRRTFKRAPGWHEARTVREGQ